MKKTLTAFVIFGILSVKCALAQFGIQGSYIAPSGDNVYIFNPGMGIDLKYTTGVIDTTLTRFSFSVGYYKLIPTQDTFPDYKVTNGKLYPGYDHIKNYSVIPISGGIEYHPFQGKLGPYVGIDLNFSIISYSYHAYIESIRDDEKAETDWDLNAFPKIGLGYRFNQNWLAQIGIGYNFELVGSAGANNQSFLKSFLSLNYYLSQPAKKN